MKRYATISADIVASTSLSPTEFMRLIQLLKDTLDRLSEKYPGFWGRIVKGDSIECLIDNPVDALRIALLLKTLVKSFVPADGIAAEEFMRHGLRLVIGIGGMRIVNKELDIMDGEAIYLSGRTLNTMKSKRLYGFQFVMSPDLDGIVSIPIDEPLLNFTIDNATNRQCETMFYRLQSERDQDVAEKMKISRSGVNNNLLRLGWDILSNTIAKYENVDFEKSRVSVIIDLLRKEALSNLENGNIENAKFYYNEALEICIREYGSENLIVAELYKDFVNLYQSLDDYFNALDWCQRALEIGNNTLDEQHPFIMSVEKELRKIETMLRKKLKSEGPIVGIPSKSVINYNDYYDCCSINPLSALLSVVIKGKKAEIEFCISNSTEKGQNSATASSRSWEKADEIIINECFRAHRLAKKDIFQKEIFDKREERKNTERQRRPLSPITGTKKDSSKKANDTNRPKSVINKRKEDGINLIVYRDKKKKKKINCTGFTDRHKHLQKCLCPG